MTQYNVAFIGTGPEPDNPVWGESAAMAYRHAQAYEQHPACRLLACADIVEENAAAFADRNKIDQSNIFTDYDQMLATVDPDIISVCTPVPTHEDIVIDCARDDVQAIHCEKPMADSMGGSRRMLTACAENDVQLTFNHQRRVATPTQRINEYITDGTIGNVTRVELSTKNLFDSGTHFIDLCNYLLDEPSAKWVIGQVDYRTENVRYGVHNENEAFVRWRYDNGVDVVAAMGDDDDFLKCTLRVIGTSGEIQLNPDSDAQIRLKPGSTEPWEDVHTREPMSDIPAAIDDVVEGLETGTEPQLSASRAIKSMEIIFGAYESVRRRGRVELPPSIEDNPLVALVESGELTPESVDLGPTE